MIWSEAKTFDAPTKCPTTTTGRPGRKSCGGAPLLATWTRTRRDSTTKSYTSPPARWTLPGTTVPSSWKTELPSCARSATASLAVLKNVMADVRPLKSRNPSAATMTAPATHKRLLDPARTGAVLTGRLPRRRRGRPEPRRLRATRRRSRRSVRPVPHRLVRHRRRPSPAGFAGRSARARRSRRRSPRASRGRRCSRHPRRRSRGPLEPALLEGGRQPLGGLPLAEDRQAAAVPDEPGVGQGERDEAEEERPGHRAVHVEVASREVHRRRLVHAAPPRHREVDDRDVEEGDERGDGGPSRHGGGIAGHAAESQVAEVEHEEEGRGREEGVPRPPHAPAGPAPDRARHEGEAGEDDAGLGRGPRQAVEAGVARPRPEIEQAGERRHPVGEEGHPRHRRVDVEEADEVAEALRLRRHPQAEPDRGD